jgi:phosphoribosylaminoimidazolecarboxamide formyltransferase/IMP cyclohydrolase
VYNKDGIIPIVEVLKNLGVKLFSTGGTQKFLSALGYQVTAVEDVTGFPSIFDGRVKTLHPSIFGGILFRRDHAGDVKEKDIHQIPAIDLVIVDLYPFQETVRTTANEAEIIEKIDIGGVSLIRAAAKNFKHTCILADKRDYPYFLDLMVKANGTTNIEQRKKLAHRAFATTANYDKKIAAYFEGIRDNVLRYGENPHQNAVFVANAGKIFEQLHGKDLSYNNLLDMDAAINLMADLRVYQKAAFAIIKHNNACGVSINSKLKDAFVEALAGDPVSAFGGVFVTNEMLDEETSKEIDKIFFEIIIAPDFSNEALKVLKQKKNRMIVKLHSWDLPEKTERTILNGVLIQDRDSRVEVSKDAKLVTKKVPKPSEMSDLEFANILVKHTRSNAIILAKNKQLIGIGTGQTSRVDALHQAINKAKNFGFNTKGSVMASDAFFPFPDCVEIAGEAGIKAIIQPGGSIKDDLSIEYCNENDIAMLFTGYRHFKH